MSPNTNETYLVTSWGKGTCLGIVGIDWLTVKERHGHFEEFWRPLIFKWPLDVE